MEPVIDHVHLTVRDLIRAERFYDRFLPLLGFDLAHKEHASVAEHDYELVEYHHRAFSLGLVSPRRELAANPVHRRIPGALHHLAFSVDSTAEVDRLFEVVQGMGAHVVSEPRRYPEYCPDYYAFFFKDPDGIELEIVSFARATYF